MALYNFQKRFVPMILSGEKRHTIRAKRDRQTKPGEMLHLYTGLRQKGAQLLMRVRCTKVEEIVIYSNCKVKIDGALLDWAECNQLARSNGFIDFPNMMVFWNGRRPFRGDIIHWHFSPTPHTQAQEMKPCANVNALDAKTSSKARIVSAQKNAAAPTTTTSAKPCAKLSARAKSHARSAE